MTHEQEQAIRERLKKATPGPWQIVEDRVEPGDDRKYPELVGVVQQRRIFTAWSHPQLQGPAPVVNGYVTVLRVCGQQPHRGVSISADDAALIAHAPEDLSALLAALDAARAKEQAVLSRLEALERRCRTRAATAEQDGEEQARIVADDVADDLAALRAEMGQ